MQSVGLPQAQDHCWARRGWKKCILQDVFRIYYTNEDLSFPFRGYWGAGWDGCRRGTSDDVYYSLFIEHVSQALVMEMWLSYLR
jgi:hypothetical protein